MSNDEELPNGDKDHYHAELEQVRNTDEVALHFILCTIIDEFDELQRQRIRARLGIYRRELFGPDAADREQSWIAHCILRFTQAMDNHTPLKDIDPDAP